MNHLGQQKRTFGIFHSTFLSLFLFHRIERRKKNFRKVKLLVKIPNMKNKLNKNNANTCHNKWRSVWFLCSQHFDSDLSLPRAVLIKNQNIFSLFYSKCFANAIQQTCSRTESLHYMHIFTSACLSISNIFIRIAGARGLKGGGVTENRQSFRVTLI